MENFERMTECEQLVMKTIWDSDEEISLLEIQKRVNSKYHKTWKPQTVSTFLSRLVRKGYLCSYQHGRIFLYQILVSLEDYKSQLADSYVNFWNHDNADEFLCALIKKRPLRQDEIERIQSLLRGANYIQQKH